MTTKKQTYQYIALVNIGTNPPTKAGDVVNVDLLPKGTLQKFLDAKQIKRVKIKEVKTNG